jgi:hypothetical protein
MTGINQNRMGSMVAHVGQCRDLESEIIHVVAYDWRMPAAEDEC